MEGTTKIISEITIYFSLFYPLLYIKGFARNSKAFKLFTIYLVLIGVVQLWMRYTVVLKTGNNLYLSHYYFITQFILLSLFYKELLGYKWIHYILILGLALFTYQYVEDPNMYFRYNSIGIVLSQIILVVYALLYLYKSLTVSGPFQIVNVGVFVYLLASALIFASGNFAIDVDIPASVSNTLIKINVYLFLGFQILIFAEWWKNYSVPKIKS